MTRGEEIIIQSYDYGKFLLDTGFSTEEAALKCMRVAFIDGAQWADSHPHWISVSDKLPEDDSEVACITADGELYTDRYIRGTRYGNIWRKTEKKPIKWLPLPKKGGEQ